MDAKTKAAFALLKSFVDDINEMRDTVHRDCFSGTGGCEFGHEGVDVALEWPNLAILADRAQALLTDQPVTEYPANKLYELINVLYQSADSTGCSDDLTVINQADLLAVVHLARKMKEGGAA